MLNHSCEKSATNRLKQPAGTKACNRGGSPATTRDFDPQVFGPFKFGSVGIMHEFSDSTELLRPNEVA